MTIKVYQFDENMAIIKWDGLEDATKLAKIINKNQDDIKVKTIHRELQK